MKQKLLNKLWLRVWMLVAVMTTALAGTAWADVVSGTTYSTPSISELPEGWSGEDGNGTTYIKLIASNHFIQTSEFGQDGFKSITLKARKYGGPSADQAQISVSWYSNDTETLLGTISPSSTTLTNYTISSPNNPVGNTTGYIIIQCKGASSSKGSGVSEVTINYTAASGGSALDDCDLALTGAPIELSFDLYNNADDQVINYTTSSTGAVTIADNDYATFDIDEEYKTITVTPTAVTPSVQNVTVSQEADDDYKAGSVTFTITITDSTPIPTHTATFSVNGVTSTQDFEEGAAITFPANPADVSGKTFVGWVAEAISVTTNDAPTFVTSATMGNSDVTFYAVFAYKIEGTATTVSDVLTTATFGSPSSYTDWSGKQAENGSAAVYAGQSNTNSGNIQLRATEPSGIVTTISGGKAKKVSVKWASNTSSGRILDIYGSNTAYTSSKQLYNAANRGTHLGEIEYGTSSALTINEDYTYIGIRSSSGALYLQNITIDWQSGTPDTYSDYCTTVIAAAVARPTIEVAKNPFLFSTTATISCETEGAAIKYSFDGENWNDYTEALTIIATTTVYAKAVKDENESEVASVSITKNLAVPTVAIVATGITNTNVFDGTEAGSLAASVTYNDVTVEGATVAWSGDNDEVATIDPSTGVVTLVAAGTVTFTAAYAGNEDYAENTATYEMTVTNIDPNAPGTENNPYTVAQAIDATPASGTSTIVYIHGFVSSFYNTSIIGDGNYYRYYISDDGTTDNQLLVFRGKGLNEETFSSADDLQIGDEVVILGGLTMYSNAPEVAAGNYIVSLNRPVNPTITVDPATVNASAAETYGALELTYVNFNVSGADDFGVQFYDSEDNELQNAPDWIEADVEANGEGYAVSYILVANDGEARTAYFKVYAMDDETNLVYSNLVTVSQTAPPATYTLATTITPGKRYVIANEDGTMVMGVQNSNNRGTAEASLEGTTLSVASSACEFIIYGPDAAGFYTIYDVTNNSGYLYAASSGNNYLKTQTTNNMNGKWSITINGGEAEVKAQGNYSRNLMRYNSNNSLFSCYGSGQDAIYFYEKDEDTPVATTTSVKLNDNGYATFASTDVLDFLDAEVDGVGYSAWQITGVDDTEITFGQIKETVAAGKGVLLKGEPNTTINLNILPVGGATLSSNLLEGFTSATGVNDDEYYGLKGYTFKKVNAGTVPAGKALLPVSVVDGNSAKEFLTFVFEDEATGIVSPLGETEEGAAIYNLAGQRISKMQKGINIVNGKKILK